MRGDDKVRDDRITLATTDESRRCVLAHVAEVAESGSQGAHTECLFRHAAVDSRPQRGGQESRPPGSLTGRVASTALCLGAGRAGPGSQTAASRDCSGTSRRSAGMSGRVQDGLIGTIKIRDLFDRYLQSEHRGYRCSGS